MTVAEFIKQLRELPQDAVVLIDVPKYGRWIEEFVTTEADIDDVGCEVDSHWVAYEDGNPVERTGKAVRVT
jgi:hypothetical protein